MDEYEEHAEMVIRDCFQEGWGVFRIASELIGQEGKQTWTIGELIAALAGVYRDEDRNNKKQRPKTVQHTTNKSRTRPRDKQNRSACSVSRDMQLHR